MLRSVLFGECCGSRVMYTMGKSTSSLSGWGRSTVVCLRQLKSSLQIVSSPALVQNILMDAGLVQQLQKHTIILSARTDLQLNKHEPYCPEGTNLSI